MQIKFSADLTNGSNVLVATPGSDLSQASGRSTFFTVLGSGLPLNVQNVVLGGDGRWRVYLDTNYAGATAAAARGLLHLSFSPGGVAFAEASDTEWPAISKRMAQTIDTRLLNASGRTIYASTVGSLALDGVTDDAAALQLILNLALVAPVEFVLDRGTLYTSGNDVYSYTTIRTLAGASWKLAANAVRPILRNANKTKGVIVDQNISILGGLFDGNNSNNRNAGYVDADGYATVPGRGFSTMPLGFHGVRNLLMQDVTVQESASFGAFVSNYVNLTVTRFRNLGAASQSVTMDGFHLVGPGTNALFTDLDIKAYDDALGINADDADSVLCPWVAGGSIDGVSVNGLRLNNALLGVRCLSKTSRLTNVTVRNLTGTCLANAVHFDNFFGTDSQPSPGNYGKFTFDGVDVMGVTNTAPDFGQKSIIFVDRQHVEELNLLNLKPNRGTDGRPYLTIGTGSQIDRFNAPNLAEAIGGALPAPAWVAASEIYAGQPAGYLRYSSGTVAARVAYLNTPQAADTSVSAVINAPGSNSVAAKVVELWLRGPASTNWAAATCYGLDFAFAGSTGVRIYRFTGGAPTTLGTVNVALSNTDYYRVFFSAVGTLLAARVQRASDGAWLNSAGAFVGSGAPINCLSVNDGGIAAAGYSGVTFYSPNVDPIFVTGFTAR